MNNVDKTQPEDHQPLLFDKSISNHEKIETILKTWLNETECDIESLDYYDNITLKNME